MDGVDKFISSNLSPNALLSPDYDFNLDDLTDIADGDFWQDEVPLQMDILQPELTQLQITTSHSPPAATTPPNLGFNFEAAQTQEQTITDSINTLSFGNQDLLQTAVRVQPVDTVAAPINVHYLYIQPSGVVPPGIPATAVSRKRPRVNPPKAIGENRPHAPVERKYRDNVTQWHTELEKEVEVHGPTRSTKRTKAKVYEDGVKLIRLLRKENQRLRDEVAALRNNQLFSTDSAYSSDSSSAGSPATAGSSPSSRILMCCFISVLFISNPLGQLVYRSVPGQQVSLESGQAFDDEPVIKPVGVHIGVTFSWLVNILVTLWLLLKVVLSDEPSPSLNDGKVWRLYDVAAGHMKRGRPADARLALEACLRQLGHHPPDSSLSWGCSLIWAFTRQLSHILGIGVHVNRFGITYFMGSSPLVVLQYYRLLALVYYNLAKLESPSRPFRRLTLALTAVSMRECADSTMSPLDSEKCYLSAAIAASYWPGLRFCAKYYFTEGRKVLADQDSAAQWLYELEQESVETAVRDDIHLSSAIVKEEADPLCWEVVRHAAVEKDITAIIKSILYGNNGDGKNSYEISISGIEKLRKLAVTTKDPVLRWWTGALRVLLDHRSAAVPSEEVMRLLSNIPTALKTNRLACALVYILRARIALLEGDEKMATKLLQVAAHLLQSVFLERGVEKDLLCTLQLLLWDTLLETEVTLMRGTVPGDTTLLELHLDYYSRLVVTTGFSGERLQLYEAWLSALSGDNVLHVREVTGQLFSDSNVSPVTKADALLLSEETCTRSHSITETSREVLAPSRVAKGERLLAAAAYYRHVGYAGRSTVCQRMARALATPS